MNLATETKDGWVIEAPGLIVAQLAFDFAVSLTLSAEARETVEIRIEHALTFTAAGVARACDPQGPPEQRSPLLQTLRRSVRQVVASNDGCLEIRFESGDVVAVCSGDEYESWSLRGPNGLLLVSIPGGELAAWPSESNA